jgi:two-component sensor histidine kinase
MNAFTTASCPSNAACCLDLSSDAEASRHARHAVQDDLQSRGLAESDNPAVQDSADAAVLIVSELVTNARRHTSGPCQLRTTWEHTTLVIEVDDSDAVIPSIVPQDDRGSAGGFGMDLVDHLADSWGAQPRTGGKTVYARIDFPNQGGPM